MSFSSADLSTIKTAVQGDSTANAFITAGQYGACVDYLNSIPASPTMIWMPDVPVAILLTAVVWSAFITLPAGQQAAWNALTGGGTVDATNANVRAGFVSIFGGASQTVTNLTAIAQRGATRLEALFVTSGVTSKYNQKVAESDLHGAGL